MTTLTPSIKLPVWKLVKESYRLSWQHRWEFIKLVRWWLLPLLLVNTIQDFLEKPITAITENLDPTCIDKALFKASHAPNEYIYPEQWHAILAQTPFYIMVMLIGASVAVGWHRLILRQEGVQSKPYFRLDHPVWIYCLWGVGINLFCGVITLATLIQVNIGLTDSTVPRSIDLLLFILPFIISYFGARLIIILPAKALEKPITLRMVSEKTFGSFWRLFIGQMLCTIAACIIAFKPGCHASAAVNLGYEIVGCVAIFLILPPYFTYLSLAYRHFFEQEGDVVSVE